jgi:pimeloyl-ACP methyl ester carboxylesterase
MNYTSTWSDGHGEIAYFTRADGSRLRYFTAGTGPAVVLLHTVRTQLDYFQKVIPQLWDYYTVYALDLPGMGWSDIVDGARYEEPDLRSAVVEFITGLDLRDVMLAGESLGAALALLSSTDLADRVVRVVGFNTYDYPSGLERGNWFARFIISSVRAPVLGPIFARQEIAVILRNVMRGGFVDKKKLPDDFVAELRRSGRRRGYSRVARAIYRSLIGFMDARERYRDVRVPVTLVYSQRDWSRDDERAYTASLLSDIETLTLPETGHFSALERPDAMAQILLTGAGPVTQIT